MLFSKASEGDFIRNGWVSEDFTLSGFLFRKRMVVPNRLKVRPEAFPKSIPMSAISFFFASLGLSFSGLAFVTCAVFMVFNISKSFFGKGATGRALEVFFKIEGVLPVIEGYCSFYTPGLVF